jgi:CheY-specific phosphatase CheX
MAKATNTELETCQPVRLLPITMIRGNRFDLTPPALFTGEKKELFISHKLRP